MRRALLLFPFLAACAPHRPAGPALVVTVVVTGEEPAASAVRQALSHPSGVIEPQLAEPPRPIPSPGGNPKLEAALSAARASYVDAEFRRCLTQLPPDSAVRELLGVGQRLAATRVLLWRIACETGGGDKSDAVLEAARFATLGLEIPPDIGSVSPQVEALLSNALKTVSEAPRIPVSIVADVSPATLAIDGRPAACAVPCSTALPAGDHLLRLEADGVTPLVRELAVAPPLTNLHLSTTAAPPETAALQWSSRYAASVEPDSEPSLRLLAVALRAPRLAFLTSLSGKDGPKLQGALAKEGVVAARAERVGFAPGGAGATGVDLLHDLLVKGRVIETPPLWKRWTFWAALAAGALVSGGAVYALEYKAPVRTSVTF